MANYNFKAAKLDIPDNHSDIAGEVETGLDALNIDDTKTIYSITTNYHAGFWHIIIIYQE